MALPELSAVSVPEPRPKVPKGHVRDLGVRDGIVMIRW